MLINTYYKNKMIRNKLPSLLIVENAIPQIINISDFCSQIYDKSKNPNTTIMFYDT